MKPAVRGVVLVGLALFFLFAGVSKLLDPVEFARSIGRYQIFGHPWTLAAALWVPWLECLAAASLFITRWRRAGIIILLALLSVFEVILAITWLRGLDISCGCLGGVMDSSVAFAFFRNVGLIGLALFLYTTSRKDNERAQ